MVLTPPGWDSGGRLSGARVCGAPQPFPSPSGEWLGDYPAFGYEFMPEFWGQAFATEAVSKVLEHWSRRYPEKHFFAYVREENLRSRRVLEKCGFVRMESKVKDEDGKLCLLYAVKSGNAVSEALGSLLV